MCAGRFVGLGCLRLGSGCLGRELREISPSIQGIINRFSFNFTARVGTLRHQQLLEVIVRNPTINPFFLVFWNFY
jgi:hypothetical protein